MSTQTIDTMLKETRVFPPLDEFRKKSMLNDPKLFDRICEDALENPEKFWEQAAQNLHWFKKWHKVLDWNPPFAKWFLGGEINASYQCLDLQIEKGRRDKTALIFESENGGVTKYTYGELHIQVCTVAKYLKETLHLKVGDRAAIYMPMMPEAVIAMLACARIGVTHSVIFAGFSQQAIKDRVIDAECKIVFTCDVGYRKGQKLLLLDTVLQGVKEASCVKNVLVLNRENRMLTSPCIDWSEAVQNEVNAYPCESLPSEHPLFILYTSGTTGKPKGIVHSTGGYLVGTHLTAKWTFDLKDTDVYWCTADIGWVTGHSYVVYGILSQGTTALIYEGALNFPNGARIWEVIDKHKVTILYTAPTAIRSFMRSDESNPAKHSLESLRLLGSVGEPINPEAWMWYHENVGHKKCPIVDTWWQTETGAIMIAPVPSVTPTKPGSATRAFPGIAADVVDEQGKSCAPNVGGYLVIKQPWPSMLRNIHNDPERFKTTYYSQIEGIYFTGDGAHKDEQGYFWIKGRIDDVLNVSGHRLGTMEIESALITHPGIAEAAVVGRDDELKGQAVVAFVIPKEHYTPNEKELKQHVVNEIGALARPEKIYFTRTLPKTRSGKIMRRLLKDYAAGKQSSGDTTTLENASLVDLIQ